MTKDELIKATQILQKHVPNRFPLENPYINAMQEYADQETSDKNSEIERLRDELNELKEKHKNGQEVISFLLGEGELDGVNYGDVPKEKARFWWRIKLRECFKQKLESND